MTLPARAGHRAAPIVSTPRKARSRSRPGRISAGRLWPVVRSVWSSTPRYLVSQPRESGNPAGIDRETPAPANTKNWSAETTAPPNSHPTQAAGESLSCVGLTGMREVSTRADSSTSRARTTAAALTQTGIVGGGLLLPALARHGDGA